MSKDKGKQVDPQALGAAIKGTSMAGKTPERWADEVWAKGNGKGGKR